MDSPVILTILLVLSVPAFAIRHAFAIRSGVLANLAQTGRQEFEGAPLLVVARYSRSGLLTVIWRGSLLILGCAFLAFGPFPKSLAATIAGYTGLLLFGGGTLLACYRY